MESFIRFYTQLEWTICTVSSLGLTHLSCRLYEIGSMKISVLRTAARKYCPFISTPTDRHISQFMVGSSSSQSPAASHRFSRYIWLWRRNRQKAQGRSHKWKGPGRLNEGPTQGEGASPDVVETCWHLGKSGMQHHCSLLSHDLTVNLRFHGCFSGTLHPAINS